MARNTYTALIAFHSAHNVPIADFHNLSADPYLSATIASRTRPRPPGEPLLIWRTHTIHVTREPIWNDVWVVGGVPADGFNLTIRLIDEDAKDRDDRLGKAEVNFDASMMKEGGGFERREVKVEKRRGSILPYVMTYAAGILPGQKVRKHSRVVVSVKIVAKTSNSDNARIFTLGPTSYSQHFSPLIGSVINRKNQGTKGQPVQETGNEKKPAAASSFVANKLQLKGPVPPKLHQQYVGYNWFIKLMYTRRGIAGRVLFHGLRKQYRTIYSYSKSTLYGEIIGERQKAEVVSFNSDPSSGPEDEGGRAGLQKPQRPLTLQQYLCDDSAVVAQQFLKMVHYGRGGRLMTYVLTLDGQWRFSETGDEFSIDFLSKHMMHADGAQYVAYAGEFFVRRIQAGAGEGEQLREGDIHEFEDEETDEDPAHYELIIDNDSGTYRPPKDTLPILQSWMSAKERLGALGRVTAMHAFDEKLQALKKAQKELKKRIAEGEVQKCHQARRGSSASNLKVDGRKMSGGEVERIVGEAKESNEGKLREQHPTETAKEAESSKAGPNGVERANHGEISDQNCNNTNIPNGLLSEGGAP